MDMRVISKHVLAQGDRLLRPPGGITILIYHRVGGGTDSEVDLPVDVFRAQLAHLAEHHRVVSLDTAVAELSGSNPIDDGVVLTFDDGTDDFVEHVVPALVEARLPASLYAATQFIDEGRDFPWDARPATWAGLTDAVDTGLITIGSHTHTHALLDRAAPAEIGCELDRSIELIGEHIGVAPAHFAYPKALPGSPAAEDEVRSRFTSAALARGRVNESGKTDLHHLWRTPIQRSDGHVFFAAKAAGGMRLEGELRNVVASVKYRSARN